VDGAGVEEDPSVKSMHHVEPPGDGYRWVVGSGLILATYLSSDMNTSPAELIIGTDSHALESKRQFEW
jgi:hypothetical protein